MRPRLLVVELWALGDLLLTTPFLRAAAKKFDVTLLAQPVAVQLQPRFWPEVAVVPSVLPWTAFRPREKYNPTQWRWRELAALVRRLRAPHFDMAVSTRWDPRDHFLIWLTGAKRRVGFPRLGSGLFLNERLALPGPNAHRYENWRAAGQHLGLDLPPRNDLFSTAPRSNVILVHTGAAQPTRIWPLDRFQYLVQRLRQEGYSAQIICNADQREWWEKQGETVHIPSSITELVAEIEGAGVFVGNDSGPGHIAASLGLPTFTLFGNQSPAFFSPLHRDAEWIEGAPCPYKPCYDFCHFARPECLLAIDAPAAWNKLKLFIEKHIAKTAPPGHNQAATIVK